MLVDSGGKVLRLKASDAWRGLDPKGIKSLYVCLPESQSKTAKPEAKATSKATSKGQEASKVLKTVDAGRASDSQKLGEHPMTWSIEPKQSKAWHGGKSTVLKVRPVECKHLVSSPMCTRFV